MKERLGAANRLISRYSAGFAAAAGVLIAVGLVVSLVAVTGLPGARAGASTPASGGSPAPLVAGPPIPIVLPGANGSLVLNGYGVASVWPMVAAGAPGYVANDSVSGAVVLTNAVTGVSTVLPDPTLAFGSDFGVSVALTSSLLVVGAPAFDSSLAGAVYVFDASTLALEATLHDPNNQNGSYFGWSVAVSGTTVVVGAPNENGTLNGSGAAFVFKGPSWFASTLASPHPRTGGEFGGSVSLSGSYVVVGAPGENASGTLAAGRAYEFSASTGSLIKSFVSPHPVTATSSVLGSAGFGQAVSIVGNVVAVGSPTEPGPLSGGHDAAGVVYLYNLVNGSRIAVTSSSPQYDGLFGYSVSLGAGGTWLAVGAPGQNSSLENTSGAAYVFNVKLGVLESGTFVSSNPQAYGLFGLAVGVSSNQVIVGAPAEGNNLGHTYVFRNPAYTLLGGGSPVPYASFGWSVAVSGHTVAIGAPDWGADGAVWVLNTAANTEFRLTGTAWAPGGDFGYSVALSGTTLAVGAPAYDEDEGIVLLFDVANGAYLGTVSDPNALSDGTPIFGFSVALSGTNLVVGAPAANGFAGEAFLCSTTNDSCSTTFAPIAGSEAYLGYSVAVNGTTAVVGAPLANSTSGPAYDREGAAWVLNFGSGLTVTQLTLPAAANYTLFGASVAIDAGQVIVGTPGENVSGINASGAAYIYNRTTDALTQSLYSPNAALNGDFGLAVAIGGSTAVVGAPYENTSSASYGNVADGGNAYLFNALTGAATYAFADPNPTVEGNLGFSVAIAGQTVVVGAPSDTAFGSEYTGCAYIL